MDSENCVLWQFEFCKKNDKVYVNTGSCNIGILHYLHFEWLMKMLTPAMRRRSILEIHNKEKTYCGCIVWRSAIGRLMKMQRIRAKLVLKSSCTALLPLHLICSSTKCWFSQWATIVFNARPPDLFYACKNLAKRWLTCNFWLKAFAMIIPDQVIIKNCTRSVNWFDRV